jgi:hypothetical protein
MAAIVILTLRVRKDTVAEAAKAFGEPLQDHVCTETLGEFRYFSTEPHS